MNVYSPPRLHLSVCYIVVMTVPVVVKYDMFCGADRHVGGGVGSDSVDSSAHVCEIKGDAGLPLRGCYSQPRTIFLQGLVEETTRPTH